MEDFAGLRYPWAEAPEAGTATEVAPGIWWVRLPLPMALDHVNVHVLDDGDGWTVIDTGLSSDQTRAIWTALLDGPLAAKPVTRLIVTHHHPDHVGLAGWFVARGAELWMTRTAYLMARMLTLDQQAVHDPGSIAFHARNGMDPGMLARRAAERPFNFADCVDPVPLGYSRLVEGAVIRMGGRDWDVRMGNGHAPEHATFWSRDDALVIGGDQMLPSISPNLGVYPTEPEADPVADWLESCTRLSAHATADQLVLGGHKTPYVGLPTRLTQLIQNHHGALSRLWDHLAEPRRGGDCFAPLFKREIGAGVYGLAMAETIAHLNHLHQTGRADRWLGADGVYLWQRR